MGKPATGAQHNPLPLSAQPERARAAGDKATAYITIRSTASAGYDAVGGRYKRYTVDTCKAKCDAMTGCAGFTFAAIENGDERVCTLKTWIPIVGLRAASGVDTYVGEPSPAGCRLGARCPPCEQRAPPPFHPPR